MYSKLPDLSQWLLMLMTLFYVNNVGISVVSKPAIRVINMPVKLCATTFAYLCCRITFGSTSTILAVTYRPGSVSLLSAFFTEFITLLELLSSFALAVTITGNVNIHFQNENEINTQKINDIINVFRLAQHVLLPVYEYGGILDVIISPSGCSSKHISVDDIRLQTHILVCQPHSSPNVQDNYTQELEKNWNWNSYWHTDTVRVMLSITIHWWRWCNSQLIQQHHYRYSWPYRTTKECHCPRM